MAVWRSSRALILVASIPITASGGAAGEELPSFLRDRGRGIATSMFATYVEPGELLIYPFFEYYYDKGGAVDPTDLGFAEETELSADYRATEELIYLGYGISDRIAVEIEAAIIQAELEWDPGADSELPREIEASGLGDVEGQIRWRWAFESASRPEWFSYFETVAPTQDEGSLIGTADWEFKLGTGLIKGFDWGTTTLRAAVEYDKAEGKADLGELALEYMKRISDHWQLYGGIEGTLDEVELISDIQWRPLDWLMLRINNAFGATPDATDWAPEVGVLVRFRP